MPFLNKMQDIHRLFLQCLISTPFMSEAETKASYSRCVQLFNEGEVEGNFDLEGFENCIRSINSGVRSLFLEVRKGVSEDDGTYYYGLVNNSEDQIARLATNYSPHDIDFFRKVLDTLVQSEDGTAESVHLLHAAADLPKSISVSNAENLLDMWVKDKWLSKSSGSYWLGPRAYLELQPYLKRIYHDYIVDCSICMNIVLRGQNCVACDVKIHHHCAAKYFYQRILKKCPGCQIEWPHDIDPSLARMEVAVNNGSYRQNARSRTSEFGSSGSVGKKKPRR
ncbi:non-structural maintenance of chromosomes element 1 homolog [Xenia sp. Carnegie-2017]|uniref:non-structural maintenance of chromosomes element 1 homolog n=1 Tax=Xenia sp. Carnegie-2017 TaxID=2897299 RepID=UPI001F049EC4|nr:non-structural maintenance of chromosomes element 1 homolog [Xenia sp. Carnegie-2017]